MNDLLKQLDTLAPLAAAATEGPWVTTGEEVHGAHGEYQDRPFRAIVVHMPTEEHDPATTKEDLCFIAAARNFLTPANLSTLRAALATPVDGSPAIGAFRKVLQVWTGKLFDTQTEIVGGDAAALLADLASAGMNVLLSASTPVGEDVGGEANSDLQAKYEAAMKVLRGYEKWEADIISSDDAWNTRSGHPWMTDEIYDDMMDLQHDRNAVLATAPLTEKEEGRDQVNAFCEKPGHVCTMTYCDNNGCNERIRPAANSGMAESKEGGANA